MTNISGFHQGIITCCCLYMKLLDLYFTKLWNALKFRDMKKCKTMKFKRFAPEQKENETHYLKPAT